ncbi:MAG: hypothetical protein IIV59_05080, partial [Selenomonadaceae bacterium]|nr:hypothetical protein [Selenomonadaceae bacterium]
MERIDKDETIDFQRLFAIIADRKKLFGKIIAGFTVLALIISLVWPKEYTSEVTVQASSGDMGIGGAAAAMAALAGAGTSSKATTYIELMKTRTVLEPIIDQVFDDEPKEDRPEAEKFAKKFGLAYYNFADLMNDHGFSYEQILVILEEILKTGQTIVIEGS